MAITIDEGLIATDDPLANDLAVSMEEQVAMLDKDNTQFTSMLMKLPSRTAKSFKEEWLEDELIPRHTALSASAASDLTGLSLTTGEGAYGKVGDIVLIVQTGEHVRITTAGASAWTVVRAVGSVAAATAQSGTTLGGLIIVQGSNAQGGTLPTAMVTQKTTNYNYLGIQRDSYRFTATAEWVRWYSGNPLTYHRRKVGIEHKRNIELTLFSGARSYSSSDPPRSTGGGLDTFVTTNITDIAGAMDKGEWGDFLRTGLEYGERSRKVLFASPIVAQVLSEFLADNWVRASKDETVWGVKVDAVIDGVWGARIPVIVKGDWKRFGEGTGKHKGSIAYLVDMTNVELVKAPATTAGPRFASLYSKRQANDADEQAEEYLSEFGLIVRQERSHSILRGVTG